MDMLKTSKKYMVFISVSEIQSPKKTIHSKWNGKKTETLNGPFFKDLRPVKKKRDIEWTIFQGFEADQKKRDIEWDIFLGVEAVRKIMRHSEGHEKHTDKTLND